MAKKENSELIFVNAEKKLRAQEILALLKRSPKTDVEQDKKSYWAAALKDNEVAEEDALEFVYTQLGGLTRTHEEHVKAEEAKAAAAAKGRKKSRAKSEEE